MSERGLAAAGRLLLAALALAAPPSVAQQPSEAERLRQVIEAQQQRLEAQEAQLREQREALQKLSKEVDALQGGDHEATAPPAAAKVDKASPSSDFGSLEQSISAAQEPWPGSIALQGVNTRLKISGFAELDVLHDTDAIETPSAFVTSAIVTGDATAAEGADGQTNFSVQPTRLAFETRTPLHGRRLTTFLSVDFFGDFESTSADLRLREVYGEVTDILAGGDLLFGQTWSTYTNLYATPNTLDFQTPNAVYGLRHPMVRWTKGFGHGLTLKLAAEAPDDRNFVGASPASLWPDGVIALVWDNGPVNLQGSYLARDLRASGADGSAVSAFGWGANLSGRIHMPGALKQDFATFGVTYGTGIGGVMNDAPPDAIYDPATNELEPIPTRAWLGSYQHWWNPNFYSVVSYGEIRQDNEDIQGPSAYKKTQYSSANVVWTPYAKWLFGFEVLYGTREDNDGAEGSDVRTQFTSRFTF